MTNRNMQYIFVNQCTVLRGNGKTALISFGRLSISLILADRLLNISFSLFHALNIALFFPSTIVPTSGVASSLHMPFIKSTYKLQIS